MKKNLGAERSTKNIRSRRVELEAATKRRHRELKSESVGIEEGQGWDETTEEKESKATSLRG